MLRRRLARCIATVPAAALLAVACTTDDPAQTLPCQFYENQVDTGAIDLDEVPDEECRDRIREGQGQGR